ncbi:hypothetical protein Syun_024532 [Stephania yunnanensis]|uniref:DUF1664 domain-containing protein n=1 Tax=Stephania yunnanensis TaxID=152371 RepID=A0AAP0NKW3_9MAGN
MGANVQDTKVSNVPRGALPCFIASENRAPRVALLLRLRELPDLREREILDFENSCFLFRCPNLFPTRIRRVLINGGAPILPNLLLFLAIAPHSMALPVAKLTIFVFKQFERGDSRPTNGKPHNDTLMAQVNSLREELLQLSYNKPITIITTGRSGAGTYGIPVILVVVVGYGFIWWKGWKLSDFMFVTRRGFSDACSSVGKQVDQVSSSLSAAKRHLSSRIDRVDGNIDECAQITAATRDENVTARGVRLLCGVVGTLEINGPGASIQVLRFSKSSVSASGLKVLCTFVL